jgi:hypothetical protein
MKIYAKTSSRPRAASVRSASRHLRAPVQALRKALKRQCALANEADKRDSWRQFLFLPE